MAEPRTLTIPLDQRREAERRKYLKLASSSSRYGGTNHGRDAYTTVIGWMPRFVVDFGCGSGVLGIAAALLGAGRVVCVDNDPQALEATAANAERNGVSDRLEISSPADFGERAADAVVANILAAPLVRLAPALTDAVIMSTTLLPFTSVPTDQAPVTLSYTP